MSSTLRNVAIRRGDPRPKQPPSDSIYQYQMIDASFPRSERMYKLSFPFTVGVEPTTKDLTVIMVMTFIFVC